MNNQLASYMVEPLKQFTAKMIMLTTDVVDHGPFQTYRHISEGSLEYSARMKRWLLVHMLLGIEGNPYHPKEDSYNKHLENICNELQTENGQLKNQIRKLEIEVEDELLHLHKTRRPR